MVHSVLPTAGDMSRSLRCMAEGRNGEWWGVCLDLDIAVQGKSFADVRRGLEDAIAMYLERVAELPPDEQQQFLNRRAPWHLRTKFALRSMLRKLGKNDEHREFTLTTHAHA